MQEGKPMDFDENINKGHALFYLTFTVPLKDFKSQ